MEMDHEDQVALEQQLARLAHDARPLNLDAEISIRRALGALGAPPDTPAQMARISFKKLDNFAFSVELSPMDGASADSSLFTMARYIQAEILNRTGLISPAEFPHSQEPLMPAPDGWARPDGDIVASYGSIQYAAKREARESGVLRWWLDSSEHGVISDYEIAGRGHGVYRAAIQVRPISSM